MGHRNASRRGRSAIALLSVGFAGSLALGAPASASPQHSANQPSTNQPSANRTNTNQPGTNELGGNDMGSQIRLREGAGNAPLPLAPSVSGIDVSSHQGEVDWQHHVDQGNRFAYVKATEGGSYTSPDFAQQYTGSANAGMIRGAYHFAHPDSSSGAAQAEYFIANGGGWSPDGRTLPGALDIEYNPNGPTCYGLSADQMGSWIEEFSTTYRTLTGRYPVIYTSTNWWSRCASGDFGSTNPLWVANYNGGVGELPAGWSSHTIWQHSSNPIDQNAFNGTENQLKKLAEG